MLDKIKEDLLLQPPHGDVLTAKSEDGVFKGVLLAPEGTAVQFILDKNYPGRVTKSNVRLCGRDRETPLLFALRLSFH